MKTVRVEVRDDHLETLSRCKKPILAVAELVWNGLDAEAPEVRVELKRNSMGGLEAIQVSDSGHGINYDEAEQAFGSLGGSWKRADRKSRTQERILHGKLGKGRFRAFSLNNSPRF